MKQRSGTDRRKGRLSPKIQRGHYWDEVVQVKAERDRLREGFEKLKRRFEEVDIDPYEDWDTGSFGEIIDAALEPPKGE